MSKNKTIFRARLREARMRAGLPQDKLGVLIGLDEGTASARISRYEGGVHQPPFEIVLKIAGVLNVEPAYFYCPDDELARLLAVWDRLPVDLKECINAIVRVEWGRSYP